MGNFSEGHLGPGTKTPLGRDAASARQRRASGQRSEVRLRVVDTFCRENSVKNRMAYRNGKKDEIMSELETIGLRMGERLFASGLLSRVCYELYGL
jgi:hypothetical protein